MSSSQKLRSAPVVYGAKGFSKEVRISSISSPHNIPISGALVLLSLYAALLLRGLFVVGHAKERFGALLAFGILANIFWQVLINLGMTTGLLPVVGMTLPYLSYGGSSLLTLMASMGLVINVSMRRLDRERLPRF